MTEIRSKRVLIGIDAIMIYLGISEPTFKKFIRLGMPARVIDNRWYAHADNLDSYFQTITARNDGNIPENAE